MFYNSWHISRYFREFFNKNSNVYSKKIKESGCRKGTNVPFIIEKKDISVVTDKLNESSTNIESPTKDWDFCSDSENV